MKFPKRMIKARGQTHDGPEEMGDSMIYKGTQKQTKQGGKTVTVDGNLLAPRNDVRDHSSTGFNWGYGGSGPAQLALAILASEYGEGVALKWYQPFKWAVVAKLPSEWTLTSKQVQEYLDSIKVAHAGIEDL